jgi:hypothetical protein
MKLLMVEGFVPAMLNIIRGANININGVKGYEDRSRM